MSGPRPERPSWRERVRRDPFLFGLLLVALGFTTFAAAVTWWYFRDPVLLIITITLALAAILLFRWRG